MGASRPVAMMVIMLAIFVTCCTGCTLAMRAPKSAFSMVGDAEKSGYEIESAFNTSIIKWPGLTWSVAGTYLPEPSATSAIKDIDAFHYVYSSTHGFQLEIAGPARCAPSQSVERQTTEAFDTLLASVGGWPAPGQATLKLSTTNKPIQRYAVSLRVGRKYHVDFMIPCFQDSKDESFWLAAMIGFHESTHAALTLSGRQPDSADEREKIAIGAESCLLLALSRGSDDFLLSHPRVAGRIIDRYQLQYVRDSVHFMCGFWKGYMRGALTQSRSTRSSHRNADATLKP